MWPQGDRQQNIHKQPAHYTSRAVPQVLSQACLAITQAEVEKALPKLSNGKATGRAGWPAELLRHAAYHVTLDNGRRVKV